MVREIAALFEGSGIDSWTLQKAGLVEILWALFADFRDKLANKDSCREMEQRYGQKASAAIRGLIESLDRIR